MEFKEFSGELIPAFEDKAISKILELEGGYREKDPVTGKQVKYGIDQVANPDINVKDLTEAEARRIYSDRYYRKSGADKLPEDLALVHFDAAVNQGGMAQKFLEESGGDLDKYIQLRKAHYINLAEQDPAKYGSSLKGWMNRLDKIEQEAKGMRQEFVPFEGDLDTGKGLVQKAKEYVGEQADLLTADAKIGLINAKMGVKQNQIAGLMELQEADFAKYGKDLEGMPAEEKSKHMATRKKLEEYLGDIAKYSTEARDVEKEYGVRASTKAMMRDLPESEEYKKASTFGKFKMVGEKFIEDPYGIITDLGLQSLPQSLAVAAPALAARFGMLSPKASAFVGGSTSAMNQFGSEYSKLREQGMDHIEAWEKAGVKSGVVGLFDAASFMSAGNAAEKIMSNISKGAPKAIKETAKVVGKETGRQAALGAAGEVAGATVIGQEIEPTEVAAEAIGEVFGAPGEAVTTYRGKRAEAAAPRVAPQFTEVSPEDVIPATEVRKEPTFEEAPEIEVRGVGQVPTSEALDYEAMLAELEGIEAPKPAVAEEVVAEEIVEEPVAKVKKAVTEVAEPAVSEITPEDTREIKALEQQAKKISSAPTELGRFLQRQGIQPSEKSDLGLEKGKKGNRPAIFRGSAPSFDELTSRAISEGFLLPSGDDVQDVNNFREYVSEFLTSGNVSTGPDAARAAQLNDIQDQINSIKDKYVKKEEFGLEATTPEMLKAQEETRKAREAEAAAIEAQDAAERERQEIRRLGEKGAEDFALGRTAAEDLMGQRSVFEQAPEDIDAEMARKAEEGRAEIERRKAAGEEDFDIPFNIERRQTDTPQFKKWFGDSKVASEDGKPLVVYHGTDAEDFSVFNPASWFSESPKESSRYTRADEILKKHRAKDKFTLTDDTSPAGKYVPYAGILEDLEPFKKNNIYATDDGVYKFIGNGKFLAYKNIVVDYDNTRQDQNGNIEAKLKIGKSQEAIDRVEGYKAAVNSYFSGGERGRVYPVYLSIKNPVYLDALEANKLGIRLGATPELIKQTIDKYKAMGYDGIITESDEAKMNYSVRSQIGGIPKQYIPFDANQIKSAIGNRGTFSDSDNITFNIERIAAAPAFYPDEIERKPSLRVELNRLVKANREGKVPPENFAMRAEQLLETTKKERKYKPRERGQDIIVEKLRKSVRRGELSREGLDLAEWFIKKNPALVDDIAISIRAPKDGEFASGMYNPLSRMIFLMKGSGNSETAVHEILHHTERMMPEDVQNGIRKAWSQSLFKADKAAQKGKDADLKKFFQHLMDYHFNGDKKAMKKATDMLNNGLVDYDQYQYINPSEFWAVNAADIVAKRYAVANSIVGKLKRWLAELAETIKNIFGFDNKAPLIKALNSLSKADGKFVSKDMLGHALNYANVHRNYKGEAAPLATWVEPNDSKLSDFLYKIQDRFVDVKDVQKAITDKVGQIEDQWDVYLKEELYHGRTATQAKEFLRDELMPVLNEMAKNNVNLQDFDDYLHNRHAQEYNEHVAKINLEMPDGGSGIFTEDAQAYLASLSPEKKKVYESLAKKIDNIVQGTQKILVKSGLEEQSAIDAWNKTFKYYVPLFRKDLDFSPTSGSGMGMGFGVRGATSKRAMGSFKDVADIFANIAAQREKAIVRAEKSRLGKALYGLAIKNPNPDFWLPVNPDAIKSKSALKRELVNMGLDETDAESIIQEPKTSYIDSRTGLVAYRVNPLLRSSDNVFPVRINGKDRYIFFNPSDPRANRMVRTLKNLDADQLGTLLNISAKITRWIASVNTQYNPVFGAYNFLRDVGGAQFNLSTTPIAGKQVQVTANVFPALRAIYRDVRRERAGKDPVDNEMSKLWQEFQKEGGITGFRDQFSKTNEEKNAIQKELEKLTESTTKTVAMAPFRAVFSWLSDYNESMENAVRLAAYKVALDQGLSKERAASLAKNLTVNFNRKGEKTKQANALFAFFNASVQGTKRLQETLSGPAGKKIVGGGLLLGVLQALMLAAAGFDEDEPPEFVKERNIIIPLGDGKYAAIPMPLGLHVIPSTGRMVTEFVMSGGKNPAKFTGDFLSMYLSAFNPIGNSGLSMQTISPTALDPIAAIFENRDNFGRPIAKEDRATNPTPGYTRTRDNASTIGKYLSEFLNYATGGTKYQKGLVSPTPDQIDYLIGQATGGVGREVQKVEQLITGDEETPPHKIPLVGKFYGDAASQSAQKNKFYANVVKMANHEQEIKGRIKNRETTSDYLEENPDARLWRMANRVENEITQLNKRKKELKEKGASPEVIKRIDEIKLRKMQQFNERVAEAEGR